MFAALCRLDKKSALAYGHTKSKAHWLPRQKASMQASADAYLALQERPDAGIALGQECARVEHARGRGEGCKVNGDGLAPLLLQPLARLLVQAFIACAAMALC